MPTAALPVLDVVSIEWPDEDTPCCNPTCDRAAVWWWECSSGCGYTGFVCQAHCESDDDRVSRALRHPDYQGIKCNRCSRPIIVPLQWQPLR
jgi:hypothetical protein